MKRSREKFIQSEIVFQEKSKNPKFIDREGHRYGRLTVIGFAGFIKKDPSWFCRCDCGNIISVFSNNLNRLHTSSCGCMVIEKLVKLRTTHGHSSGGRTSSTYKIWHSMVQRCTNPKNRVYYRYGGRGITVCDRWLKFENFLEDMGERPENLSLDRIENNIGYFKENCRWATMKEQNNNRRDNHLITLNGKTQTLTQWAEEKAINKGTIYSRILSNRWDVERALSTPPRLLVKK